MSVSHKIRLSVALGLLAAAGSGFAQTQTTAPRPGQAAQKPSQQQVAETPEATFAYFDKNGDKAINLEEFKSGIEERNRLIVLQRLQAQFQAMDKNQSGHLELVEFNALPMIKSAGKSAPSFAETDVSRDQKLDFKEYVGAVAKLVNSRQPPAKP